MSISPLYIPLFEFYEIILDKDSGLPLSGGIVTFYRDSQRATPKAVYEMTGNPPDYTFVSVGNVLVLGIDGDFVDGNGNPFTPYLYPYDANGKIDLYYITVVSAGGVPQFTREAVPYISPGVIPPEQLNSSENALANSQFVEILFPSVGTTVINVTGSNTVTPIAPDWDLITSGTGTVTVERLQPTAANVTTNPPYALSVSASSGLGGTFQLRQRLLHSPSLFRDEFISASLTAAVISGGASTLSLDYVPSTGTPTNIIPVTTIPTSGVYTTIFGNSVTPDQSNDPASTGYIDIVITIPTSRTIAITSIQIVGSTIQVDIPYDQQSTARQIDHLFHYYENSILHQPKENLLTGWTFGVNPFQFISKTLATVTTQTQYIADQTILYQATNSTIQSGQADNTKNFALQLTAVTGASANNNQIAIIQYIDAFTIAPYWGQIVSALVRASIVTAAATNVQMKMRLIYRSTAVAGSYLPPVIGASEPITGFDANGDPTFSTGWTAILPLNDPAYTLTAIASTNEGLQVMPAMSFDQFLLPQSLETTISTMTLGVVLYVNNNINNIATQDSILIDRVSLTNNNFAIDAAPLTYDETLRRCQYYYEQTFPFGAPANAVSPIGLRIAKMKAAFSPTPGLFLQSFGFEFMQSKRDIPVVSGGTNPTLAFYSYTSGTRYNVVAGILQGATFGTGGTNNPSDYIFVNVFTNSSPTGTSPAGSMIDQNGAAFLSTSTGTNRAHVASANDGDDGVLLYHYICDCRLGL